MSLKKANIGNDLLKTIDQISGVKDSAEDISKIIKHITKTEDLGKVFQSAGISKGVVSSTLDILDMADAVGDVTNAMDAFADSQKGIKGRGLYLLRRSDV